MNYLFTFLRMQYFFLSLRRILKSTTMIDSNIPTSYISEDRTVGEIIENKLMELGMKQTELAEITNISKSVICDVIKGNRAITAEMAVLIECAIEIPAFVLMQVQALHDIENASSSQRIQELMYSIYEWSLIKKKIPVSVLKKLGEVGGNVKENVQNVLQMFEVKSAEELLKLKKSEQTAFLRRSYKIHFDEDTLFTWKHYCFHEARKVAIGISFKEENIDLLTNELIKIFYENENTYSRVREAFFNAGIRLLYIDKVGQLPVDGMSFWRDNNPTVVLTRRMKNIDSFAFSTMHELGHVKHHLKKDQTEYINFDTTERDSIEAKADEFAQNVFIEKNEWQRFMDNVKDINPFAIHKRIESLAKDKRINPQILFGRYMHDTKQYRLRRVFETEIR